MTDTSRYMTLLAKVMYNKNSIGYSVDKEKYNKLYFMIHSDLNKQLQKSIYPYTSDIIQKTEYMLNSMETLYIFPEIVRKKCILISSKITSKIFDTCKSLFINKEFISTFKDIYTKIPFIIVDTDDDNSIEILNYANVRIRLSESELKFLIIESCKRKIALNQVIQFIIIKTKLSENQLCIIGDNIYSDAEKTFWRVVSKKLTYIDVDDIKTIGKKGLDNDYVLLMKKDVFINNIDNPEIKEYHKISFNEINKYIKNEVKSVLYGFLDEFTSIQTQIIDYYDKELSQIKNTLQDVISDKVRLGHTEDDTLKLIQLFEEKKEKILESDLTSIKDILKNIEKLVLDICAELGENLITGRIVSRYTIDDIFESFFRCKKFNNDLGKKILSRIYSYEYDNYELITEYVKLISGTKPQNKAIEIGQFEWEKAKILINILDPDKVPIHYLSLYIEILGDRCYTGKELYVKSIVSPEKQKIELLQESFNKGYEIAGLKLLEMYKNGNTNINLLSLANSLLPEACMIIANQKMEKYRNSRKFASLQNKEFTYYKIAATKQYLPAIGKIVDELFESRFSYGFQIPSNETNSYKYRGMIDNGNVICRLCQFLIDKMYNVNHYSEVLGIVLFSLNKNLSEAMRLLMNSNSALAYYCKGNMYEFGGGVSIDLDQAIENYEKSINKGFLGGTEDRLTICQEKKNKYLYEKSRDDNYQSSNSYNSTSRKISSEPVDDGCFTPKTKILMADGSYCSVEDIKIDDWVLVFDHYEGVIRKEKIVANVHDISEKKEFNIIEMIFEDNTILEIVKSHVLFDITDNKYVWIDDESINNYIGHLFATFENGKIKPNKLVDYSIKLKDTNYYVPISRFHMNVFAENILTMPPTKLTANMFNIDKDMLYDLSVLDKIGITSYQEISEIVSFQEYEDLPCKYLAAVLSLNNCTIDDFKYALALYREQKRYLNIE